VQISDFIFNATGFRLEFIPRKIGAGMTKRNRTLNSSLRRKPESSPRRLHVLKWAVPPANDVYTIMGSLVTFSEIVAMD
jgi:hypothetical protein